MSNDENVIIKIGNNYWEILPNGTHSSNVYELKDVIRSNGEKPDFASSD